MIPSAIDIDGLAWTVQISDAMDEKNWGETRSGELRILLLSGIDPKMQEMTFWHEVIHAIFKTRDLRLNPASDDLEEQVAQLLGPALCSFFWANADIQWHNG